MSVSSDKRILSFAEKPEHPQAIPGRPDVALASMGIYIFNTDFLLEQLQLDAERGSASNHDFGQDIIPRAVEKHKVFAFPFSDGHSGAQAYWRDVGTIDSYWKANLELIGVTPELNLYDTDWPIWTAQEQVPPSKFVFDDEDRRGMAVDSMVAGGSIISGSSIKHSLLFTSVMVDAYTTVEDSVILPEVVIGKHCRIRKAVIDKGTVIPDHTEIGYNREEDEWRFHISPGGVVLVTPNMLGQRLEPLKSVQSPERAGEVGNTGNPATATPSPSTSSSAIDGSLSDNKKDPHGAKSIRNPL